jgi:hypothetical protein
MRLDMGIGFVPDIVLDNKIILEIKSVENSGRGALQTIAYLFKTDQIKTGVVD